MSEKITPKVSDRICKHMNEDHGDALVLYAKVYGEKPSTTQANMISIDSEGMNLSVKADDTGENEDIRIKFDHSLESAEDAHHTLIDMIKKAR